MERSFQFGWLDVVRRWETGVSPRLAKWWTRQDARTKVAVAASAVLMAASVLNLAGAGVSRLTSASRPTAVTLAPQVTAPPLLAEAAPPDAGQTWTVRGVWQGTGGKETEALKVGEHWRVDWLFNPTSPTGTLQVFIY